MKREKNAEVREPIKEFIKKHKGKRFILD